MKRVAHSEMLVTGVVACNDPGERKAIVPPVPRRASPSARAQVLCVQSRKDRGKLGGQRAGQASSGNNEAQEPASFLGFRVSGLRTRTETYGI
jgi:hypothetical protein